MQRVGSLGFVSLFTLIIQNAAVALITRHSRMMSSPATSYHTSTVILNQEILKLIVCLIFFGYERKCGHSLPVYWQNLSSVVFQQDTFKLAVPAALFTMQNFLIFISLANLDVMTFQMLSQTKLLSAAIFSVWILHRRLTRAQWISLLILTLGVILAHIDTRGSAFVAKHLPHFRSGSSEETHAPAAQSSSNVVDFSWLGVFACIASAVSSSLAGVWFEKIVKTSAPSLAVRNIHLSIFGIPFAILSMLVIDVRREGWSNFSYWRGWNWLTVVLCCTHALGGLLVAAVSKYADNILKGFSVAIATVLSGVYSAMFWNFSPTIEFIVGCSAVFASAIMFHVYEGKQKADSNLLLVPPSVAGEDKDVPPAAIVVVPENNAATTVVTTTTTTTTPAIIPPPSPLVGGSPQKKIVTQ